MNKVTTITIVGDRINCTISSPLETSPVAVLEAFEPRTAQLKLGPGGEVLPPTATDHVAVLDQASGLIWSVKTLDRMDWEKATKACADYRLLGESDWRLPTVKELRDLVDYERREPAIDTNLFPGTKSDWYWSSSPVVGWPERAWGVSFNFGNVYYAHRNDSGFVRPVRAARARQ